VRISGFENGPAVQPEQGRGTLRGPVRNSLGGGGDKEGILHSEDQNTIL